MNIQPYHQNIHLNEKFSFLKNSVNKKKKLALSKRIISRPHPSEMEYLLGAFTQMYEPHLEKFLYRLFAKGHAIDPSSGFGGKNAEFQELIGRICVNYIDRNKLEKIGIKFRDHNGLNSLVFWPKKATLKHIVSMWNKIVELLPDKGVLVNPSMSSFAVKFRRKYVPEGLSLQRQRLFEKLKYDIQRNSKNDVKKRTQRNPHPTRLEQLLGLFIEELEAQVRKAVMVLCEKGYSTDSSGFMDDPCGQMIEGDFQLDDNTINLMKPLAATVETNASGYTRIKFNPQEADFLKIRNTWNKIVSIIPDKHVPSEPSMTRKARDFRIAYT